MTKFSDVYDDQSLSFAATGLEAMLSMVRRVIQKCVFIIAPFACSWNCRGPLIASALLPVQPYCFPGSVRTSDHRCGSYSGLLRDDDKVSGLEVELPKRFERHRKQVLWRTELKVQQSNHVKILQYATGVVRQLQRQDVIAPN
jgi:hypothetical protein